MRSIEKSLRDSKAAVVQLAALKAQIAREFERQADSLKVLRLASKHWKVLEKLSKDERDAVNIMDKFIRNKLFLNVSTIEEAKKKDMEYIKTVKEVNLLLDRHIKRAARLLNP